jgi:hypothetical protein
MPARCFLLIPQRFSQQARPKFLRPSSRHARLTTTNNAKLDPGAQLRNLAVNGPPQASYSSEEYSEVFPSCFRLALEIANLDARVRSAAGETRPFIHKED